jgi:predicted dehydrogenase
MPDDAIRWGILGPGTIAKKFATGLKHVPQGRITAVGSQDQGRAEAFAQEFQIPNAYQGYQALVADSEVDAVYIATPHSYHKEHTLLCLQASKHVLCEKPFAINTDEAEEMISVAHEKQLF